MKHRNTAEAVADSEAHGHLVRIDHPVDPDLEVAEIQRRLYRSQGPAVLFTRPKGTEFPLLCNMFGTLDRARFLFRDTLDDVRKLVELKTDPSRAAKKPWRYWNIPEILWRLRPKIVSSGPIFAHRTTISKLPQVKCWPRDGGAFITLPQVYTEDPDRPGPSRSNLGMYRVQLGGNDYVQDREVGLHYQIHRGIGPHHAAALRRGEALKVNVIVGGPPALTLAAVMPLPEGLPELAFAGALGGRRLRLAYPNRSRCDLPIPIEADFVITGFVEPGLTKPEGPFGDHLGYYSLAHPFPVLKVTDVYHRPGAIWPFTVVGRPPQEDTTFGELIHELTGPVIPTVLPGVRAVHAVDAAGVHPLLLAIGSERYVPYEERRRPRELLTQASAILGQGQLSLAKYLFLVAHEDDPKLDIHDPVAFFRHVLERVDWEHDLHFHTETNIDTLDYSAGEGLNAGSKLVVTAAGPKRRELSREFSMSLPSGFDDVRLVFPGVFAVRGPKFDRGSEEEYERNFLRFCYELAAQREAIPGVALIVLVDDAEFAARSIDNWLWVTFTRSNPASDVLGVSGFVRRKHYGCRGPLVIDARMKPHMAPPLEPDPEVSRRVDALCARGGPLHGVIKE